MIAKLSFGSLKRNALKVVISVCVSTILMVNLSPRPARAFIVCILPPGQITTDFLNGSFDSVYGSVLQPDGKVVAIGHIDATTGSYFGLTRYNTNGSLDTTFGTGGKVTSQLGFVISSDGANAVALQPDGKIIVAGSTTSGIQTNIRVSRFNSNGSIDNSFGFKGSLVSSFPGTPAYATAVAVQPDGRIVAAGELLSQRDIALIRCNSDGSLDSTFGTGGKATTSVGNIANVYSMALQPDGKILVGGIILDPGTGQDFLISRFNANGSLDNSFGTNGLSSADFYSGADDLRAIQLQDDGKIVAVGSAKDTQGKYFWALARYNSDGTLDHSFAAGVGKAVRPVGDGTDDIAAGVRLQPDGKIVVGGFGITGMTKVDFVVGRFNSDGSVDNTFGNAGDVITDFCDGTDGAQSVLIQADGKIVAIGTSNNSASGDDFALVRFNSNGSVDQTFNGLGPVNNFDYCLRDNTSGNLLQFNSTTGAYQFTRCSDGFTISGTGKVQRSGSIITLSDKNSKCIISAGFNTGQRTGSANISLVLAKGVTQTIRINATNPKAGCSCSGQ